MRVVEFLTGHDPDALDDGLLALAPIVITQLCLSLLLEQHRKDVLRDLQLLVGLKASRSKSQPWASEDGRSRPSSREAHF